MKYETSEDRAKASNKEVLGLVPHAGEDTTWYFTVAYCITKIVMRLCFDEKFRFLFWSSWCWCLDEVYGKTIKLWKISTVSNFPLGTHYSKSQIFVQKLHFDKTPTFSRVFHPNIFLTIFLVKSKLSTAKKSKTRTFSRVFHPKKIDNFLGKSKLNFWTKNEDFE